MSLTDRDRKILLALIPLALVAAYWFLLLAPKRQEASTIKDQLTQAQGERDTAVSKTAGLAGAKRNFAKDYATVIYLGKSIPANVDMPSLLVQLDRAARGTGISFSDIKTGERDSASQTANASSSTPAGGNSSPANSSTPAASGPGQAAQSAGNAVNQGNAASTAAGGQTGTSGNGPAAGGSGSAAGASGNTALDSIPLDFQFDGSFFDLADFFHRMKRFVRVVNGKIVVRGRLMTINSWSFDTKDTGFPHVKALVHATVYLAPKAEGVAAGANSQGPQSATPASTPSGQQTASTNPAPPAATVTAP